MFWSSKQNISVKERTLHSKPWTVPCKFSGRFWRQSMCDTQCQPAAQDTSFSWQCFRHGFDSPVAALLTEFGGDSFRFLCFKTSSMEKSWLFLISINKLFYTNYSYQMLLWVERDPTIKSVEFYIVLNNGSSCCQCT